MAERKRGYKLRRVETTTGHAYSLGLPNAIGDVLPEGTRFEAQLTEDGILFRPVDLIPDPDPQLPGWLANKNLFGIGGKSQ